MNTQKLFQILHGNSFESYKSFGAHLKTQNGINGVKFTVYAPNARLVQLICSFNGWTALNMNYLSKGVWTLFVPGAQEFDMYKYRIHPEGDSQSYDRSDPFAFYSEIRPNTASIVYRMSGFQWSDKDWMKKMPAGYNDPISIYEVHAGSWKIPSNRTDKDYFYDFIWLKKELIPYVKAMGYTHIELLPLTEHPLDGSWGYQSLGYYSFTSRYGTPKDFMQFVNECHKQDIGVFIDFVPLHFAADFYGLHQYDGSCLYESNDKQRRYSPWGSILFDFSKPYVSNFLQSSLHFWIRYFHIDGIRFDAVSNLIYYGGSPDKGLNWEGIQFMKNTNETLHKKYPRIKLIAEDSSCYLKVTAPVQYDGLGFDYKWNLGWMNDILSYMSLPPEQKLKKGHLLTHSLNYFYQELFILPFSHDETVHGKHTLIDKIHGSYDEKFLQLKVLYTHMYCHPGKKLNFMGNELADFKEWDENTELAWNVLSYPSHKGFYDFIKYLQSLYTSEKALFDGDYNSESFQWLDKETFHSAVFTYSRSNLKGEVLYIRLNFTGFGFPEYQILVEEAGIYEEILNTDSVYLDGNPSENPIYPTKNSRLLTTEITPYSAVIYKKRG